MCFVSLFSAFLKKENKKRLASWDAEFVLNVLVKGAAADHHGQADLQGDQHDVGVEGCGGWHALEQVGTHS